MSIVFIVGILPIEDVNVCVELLPEPRNGTEVVGTMARDDTIESGIFSIECCTSCCVRDKENEKDHLVAFLLLFGKQKQEQKEPFFVPIPLPKEQQPDLSFVIFFFRVAVAVCVASATTPP